MADEVIEYVPKKKPGVISRIGNYLKEGKARRQENLKRENEIRTLETKRLQLEASKKEAQARIRTAELKNPRKPLITEAGVKSLTRQVVPQGPANPPPARALQLQQEGPTGEDVLRAVGGEGFVKKRERG